VPSKVPQHRPAHMPSLAQQRRQYDRSRANDAWRKFINSRLWRRCSKSYLASNPLCIRCEAENQHTPATEVHHTRGQDQEFRLDESTFEAVCHACHSRITLESIKSK
jgi:5-methylcytosine-specific restriction enzyme A